MREMDVGFLIKQISDRMKNTLDANLKEHNLTFSQIQVLEFIYSRGGKVTQKDIEIYLGVSHPTVVGLVSRLEKSGFLICSVDSTDRRNKIVSRTDMAEIHRECAKSQKSQMEKILTESLSAADVENLIRLLQIVSSNLDKKMDLGGYRSDKNITKKRQTI